MNFDIGSMWRKWDLHVHTPYSILNNQFGDDFDIYFYNLIINAIANGIKVIGITDYYMIEGYKKVRSYLQDESKLKEIFKKEIKDNPQYLEIVRKILFLCNIEFRLNNVVNIESKSKQSKVNIHVIFSDSVPVGKIDNQFLKQLHFMDGSTKCSLSDDAIEYYGNSMIKAGTCNPSDKNPKYVGYNLISVSLDEIVDTINNSFKGDAIIVGVEEDITKIQWQNQAGSIRKNYYENCDAVFSPNAKSIEWLLSKDAIETIGAKKACLWGSDAHSIETLFIPSENHYCWIKADTTFAGLIAAINSPEDRIYIGATPNELVEAGKRRNYTLSSVYVGKNCEKELDKKWFTMDHELLLNPYMITIIGNKGSGKSALADVISYLGNSYKLSKASFLNEQRFLKANTRYYKDFRAYMKLYDKDGTIIQKNILGNDYSFEKPEVVQFLPQKYIEEVCNDLGEEFQEEIDSVIYSYISPENKLDSTNLKDLIIKLTKNIKDNINLKKSELDSINEVIISLENRNLTSYKQKINNQLVIQTERLRNHESNKPEPVEKPSDLESDMYSNLDYSLANYVQKIDLEIVETQRLQNDINGSLNRISNFENTQKNAQIYIDSLNAEYDNIKAFLQISDDNKFLTYKINDSALKEKKIELSKKYAEYSIILNEQFDSEKIKNLVGDINDYNQIVNQAKQIESLFARKFFIECYKIKLQEFTSFKAKKYLDYIKNYNNWNAERRMILGEIPNTIDGESIKKYKDEIEYVENSLPIDLEQYKDKRIQIISDIFSLYDELRKVYREIYHPIQSKIDSILNDEDEKIEFRVNTEPSRDLTATLMGFMNLRVASEFKGLSDCNDKINKYINEADFENSDSIKDFVSKIYNDISKAKDLNQFIRNRRECYNYLGSLDYLNVNYSLTLGGKKLSELSPGERGIVLLVFYLALSKSNYPLIIDQPEDNLDNQSVYKRLVPCIKTAKRNRQIIVVTHNPNIAVACDSEQIIYTQMDKENYEITYKTGSLENPEIKKKVIDILEGTMPAFDMRRYKYLDEIRKNDELI